MALCTFHSGRLSANSIADYIVIVHGVILGSAVASIAFWSKASKWSCIGCSKAGFIPGVLAWLTLCAVFNIRR